MFIPKTDLDLIQRHMTINQGDSDEVSIIFLPLHSSYKMIGKMRGNERINSYVLRVAGVGKDTTLRATAGTEVVKNVAPDKEGAKAGKVPV